MRSIKEKELLAKFAKSLGQEIDPALVKEVEFFNSIKQDTRASIKKNALGDLMEAFKNINPEKQPVDDIEYPLPPTLDEVLASLNNSENEVIYELVQPQTIEESPATEETVEPIAEITEPRATEKTLAERAAKFISEAPKDSYQQPDPFVVSDNLDAVRGKLKFLEQWISKISLAGMGGGAGSVAKLDHETKVITTPAYSISTKDYYIGINYAGPVSISLPTIINDGKMYIIKDESGNCSINPITVSGNVDNDPGGFILAQDNGGIQLIYRNGWRIV